MKRKVLPAFAFFIISRTCVFSQYFPKNLQEQFLTSIPDSMTEKKFYILTVNYFIAKWS